jgi:hypothetical protein
MEDTILTQMYFLVKLYNDQRDAQVFSLFIYYLPYMFRPKVGFTAFTGHEGP